MLAEVADDPERFLEELFEVWYELLGRCCVDRSMAADDQLRPEASS
jgi:hypothetical protein